MRRTYKSGFTIVELLIVIVVIGILAAITLNAFTSAQRDARNSQTITAVKDYTKAYIAHATDKGLYPSPSSNYCLGTDYPGDLCWDNRVYTPSAVANTALRQYTGSNLPQPSTARIFVNSTEGSRAGILFVGSATPKELRYYLEGTNAQCQVSRARKTVDLTAGIECTLYLPDQTTL